MIMLMDCKLRVFSIGRLVKVDVIVKFVEELNRNVQLKRIYCENFSSIMKHQ